MRERERERESLPVVYIVTPDSDDTPRENRDEREKGDYFTSHLNHS